jgi:hypothetical protein
MKKNDLYETHIIYGKRQIQMGSALYYEPEPPFTYKKVPYQYMHVVENLSGSPKILYTINYKCNNLIVHDETTQVEFDNLGIFNNIVYQFAYSRCRVYETEKSIPWKEHVVEEELVKTFTLNGIQYDIFYKFFLKILDKNAALVTVVLIAKNETSTLDLLSANYCIVIVTAYYPYETRKFSTQHDIIRLIQRNDTEEYTKLIQSKLDEQKNQTISVPIPPKRK